MQTLMLLVSLLVADTPAAPSASACAGRHWFRQAATSGGITLLRPETVLDGELLSIELEVPSGCTPTVTWLKQEFPVYPAPEGRFQALLPVRLGMPAGTVDLTVTCGAAAVLIPVPITAGTFPESKLTVDPKFTAPPPKRVVAEQAAITEAFKKSEAHRTWTQSFVPPSHEVETSPFGVRRTFNGQTKSRHQGLDFDGKVGQPIWATNDGVVALAAKDFFFVGNAVFLDHGDHVYTMFFHMSELKVKTGDRVARGQVIGLVGNTGRATGPHVHMGVKVQGVYVNPSDLLNFVPDTGGACVADAPTVEKQP